MSDLQTFLDRCESFASERGWRRSTLSTRLFNDGGRLDQMVNGSDIGVRRLERAIADLAALEKSFAKECAA